jgi:hypothetical protein
MVTVSKATCDMYVDMIDSVDGLSLMKRDNPQLYEFLMMATTALTDREASTFMSGAIITYQLLNNQFESDDLEQSWKL